MRRRHRQRRMQRSVTLSRAMSNATLTMAALLHHPARRRRAAGCMMTSKKAAPSKTHNNRWTALASCTGKIREEQCICMLEAAWSRSSCVGVPRRRSTVSCSPWSSHLNGFASSAKVGRPLRDRGSLIDALDRRLKKIRQE